MSVSANPFWGDSQFLLLPVGVRSKRKLVSVFWEQCRCERGRGPMVQYSTWAESSCVQFCAEPSPLSALHVLSPQPLCLSCPPRKKISDLLEGQRRGVSQMLSGSWVQLFPVPPFWFIYWLWWVFTVACGLSLVAASKRLLLLVMRQALIGCLSCSRIQALGVQASVFAPLGL